MVLKRIEEGEREGRREKGREGEEGGCIVGGL